MKRMSKEEMDNISLGVFIHILMDRFKNGKVKLIELKYDEIEGGKYRVACIVEIEHRKSGVVVKGEKK
jgi:hypothetical protein